MKLYCVELLGEYTDSAILSGDTREQLLKQLLRFQVSGSVHSVFVDDVYALHRLDHLSYHNVTSKLVELWEEGDDLVTQLGPISVDHFEEILQVMEGEVGTDYINYTDGQTTIVIAKVAD